MDGYLCIVPLKYLCFIFQNERRIFSKVTQNINLPDYRLHLSSLRNVACCVAVNEWRSRSNSFSSNDSVISSVDFTVVTKSHLSF
jgi:hypothetical protein